MAGPSPLFFFPIFIVVCIQICMVCFCIKMSRASKNLQNIMAEIPDDPVYASPNGEKVGIPYVEEQYKKTFGFFWCIIKGFMPKVRGLPRDVAPLVSHEKEELLTRLVGNWKIQPLQGTNNTAMTRMIVYEDFFVSGNKIIMSGGAHNAYAGVGSDRRLAARANEAQESRIVPFRGKDGSLYLDQIGSKVIRESADGGEIELDNAMGFRLLLQREWKRQGRPAPAATTAAASTLVAASAPVDPYVASPLNPVMATPVVVGSVGGAGRDIPGEIAQLQQLRDTGALTEGEFAKAKARLLDQWMGSQV